jgi:hypothetical protein
MKATVVSDRDYHGTMRKFEQNLQLQLDQPPDGHYLQDIKLSVSEHQMIAVIVWGEIPTST